MTFTDELGHRRPHRHEQKMVNGTLKWTTSYGCYTDPKEIEAYRKWVRGK